MSHPVITIFAQFTRRWAVDRFLENLDNIEHDPELTNLALIVDTDEPYIKQQFERFAGDGGYRSFHFILNHESFPNEVRIAIRRQRIADVKNQSKELIEKCDGDYVLAFEDDTVFPDLNIMKLIQPLIDFPDVGFVEGVQVGRWGVRMVGVWKADDPSDPTRVETLLPQAQGGYQEIDGGGWYGYATRKDLYLKCDYYTEKSQPWGPDVNYGLWLRTNGYKCLVDWDTNFGHNDHNKIYWPSDGISQIIYTRDINTTEWKRHDRDIHRS